MTRNMFENIRSQRFGYLKSLDTNIHSLACKQKELKQVKQSLSVVLMKHITGYVYMCACVYCDFCLTDLCIFLYNKIAFDLKYLKLK